MNPTDLILPDDCPACCGHVCAYPCCCGYIDYPPGDDGRQRPSVGLHRKCHSCGRCYEIVHAELTT